MRAVVPVGGDGLAVGAEVRVVAHRTLVADTFNIRDILLVFAERTIAVDSVMPRGGGVWLGKWFVDGHKPMAGMDELGGLDTFRAEVPIGAVEALVAHAVDELGAVRLCM